MLVNVFQSILCYLRVRDLGQNFKRNCRKLSEMKGELKHCF